MLDKVVPKDGYYDNELVKFEMLILQTFGLEDLSSFQNPLSNPQILGSTHDGQALQDLRNHPSLNNHIPELLVTWEPILTRKP